MQTFIKDQFIEALDECRRLFVDTLIECYIANPDQVAMEHDVYFADVEHRFTCLVIKAFVETAESDLVWSPGEAALAKVLVHHLLGGPVREDKLKESFQQLSDIAHRWDWAHLLEPMRWYESLHEHYEGLKTGIIRVANIAAKVDGQASRETLTQLQAIQWQLDQHLETPTAEPDYTRILADPVREQALAAAGGDADAADLRLSDVLIQLVNAGPPAADASLGAPEATETESSGAGATGEEAGDAKEDALEKGLAELDALIGIEDVKREVRTLVNLCKMQQHRQAHDLPTSPMSLHMVFTGNPGTGKTTVARIMGKLLGAMGILAKGHLVEIDRSGLVAEFLGQTAQKTNAKIDEALDGVLFIDEAYSLAAGETGDSYGSEAIQILLKRMEDDRDRIVVILAGYPQPMDEMLKSNPGLSSRFSRLCHFPDYSSDELCEIFTKLAESHHYQSTPDFRSALRDKVDQSVAEKDEHFGNGRMVRNIFELTIRNMANRVVQEVELNPELLSTFQPQDLGVDRG